MGPYAKAIVAAVILGAGALASSFGMELPYHDWINVVLVGGGVYAVSNG